MKLVFIKGIFYLNDKVVKHSLGAFAMLFITCLTAIQVSGQGIVTVDNFKGRAQVSIPISSISKGNISVPVSLDYVAAGVKVADEGAGVGLGWSLNAGGGIVRVLKDLPDDKSGSGWLFGTNASLVESFSIANDNNTSTCTDETTDVNYLSTNFPVSKDSEPDVFHISAPGLSCQLVFDKNHLPKVIPYQDYAIAYTTDSIGVNTFTITNDNGTKYLFSLPDLTTKKTLNPITTPVPYFNREYNLYTTAIKFYSKWYLTKVTDASGNFISIDYTSDPDKSTMTPVAVKERNISGGFIKKKLYDVSKTVQSKNILKINGGGYREISFSFEPHNFTSYRLAYINIPGGRRIFLNHKLIQSTASSGTISRSYLESVWESGCDVAPPYQFFYKNVDLSAGTSILPILESKQQDAWGYYNAGTDTTLTPKIYVYPYNASYPNLERYRLNPAPGYAGTSFVIDGANRSVNPAVVAASTLNQIVYPTGGSTTIEYEPNNYFDNSVQSTFDGGGLRVKKITNSDGLNVINDISTEYTYSTPGTSVTSGRVLTMPSFAFAKAYTGGPSGTQAYWEFSTLRSEEDVSVESTDVVYGFVTTRQVGLGKSVSEYAVPATNWDAPIGDWAPSVSYVGRTSCVSSGDLINSKNIYPYAPNPNYSFKRGLLKSVVNYNESNVKVNQTEYTYQAANAPVVIQGLKFDELNGIKTYSKYNLLTSTDELRITEKNTVFDLTDVTKLSETTFAFTYAGSAHKQVTKSSTTNSDGIVNNTYFKYVKDYATSGAGDAETIALNGLKSINANLKVETYKSIVKPAEAEKYISGSLIKYQTVPNAYLGSTMYVPRESLQFVSNDGVTTFLPSQVASLTTFQHDSKYVQAATYEYDKYAMLTTVNSRNKSIESYHFNSNLSMPYAAIKNAKRGEVVYSGFDSTYENDENSFLYTGTGYSTDSRTGARAVSVLSSNYIQKSLKKGNAKNYIFSVWLKPASTGNLTVTITSTTSVVSTATLSYTTSATWKYYELSIPVTNMTTTFTVKAQPSTTLLMDDALFYPGNAEVNTFSYSETGNRLAETNSNGISVYYEYDRMGRLKYVRDQDKNIVRKETYRTYNTVPALNTPILTYDESKTLDGISIPFNTTYNNCFEGVTYNWDFGDGTAVVINNVAPFHTYTNAGTYNVTVTAVHPVYGTKTTTQAVVIVLQPLNITICGSGVIAVDNCHVDAPLISTCSGFPSSNNRTYFNVSNISGCSGSPTYTYQWEVSTDNGATWAPSVTTAGYTSTLLNLAHEYGSYTMRVKITSSCGRTGTSNEATFIGYISTPDCL